MYRMKNQPSMAPESIRQSTVARRWRPGGLDERHHQFAREGALRSNHAQLVRCRKQLHQLGDVAMLDQMEEALDAQHVVDVHHQLIVEVGQGHVAGKPTRRAQRLNSRVLGGATGFEQRAELRDR
jgi:hypothetical protein